MDIPKEYFDIVYSIYALGWTSNLRKTLELIYSYLKPGGSFIFSWEHPVYSNLQYGTEEIALSLRIMKKLLLLLKHLKGKKYKRHYIREK